MLPAHEHEADTGGAEQGERVDDREALLGECSIASLLSAKGSRRGASLAILHSQIGQRLQGIEFDGLRSAVTRCAM
jgi:hypothetical protein